MCPLKKKAISINDNDKDYNIEEIVNTFFNIHLMIDAQLTNYLMFYFVRHNYNKDWGKGYEFVEYFLQDEKFERKTKIFTAIISKNFPKYKKILSKKNFDDIRHLRNRIAHSVTEYEIDSNDSSQNKLKIKYLKTGGLISEYLTCDHISDVTNNIGAEILAILNKEVKKMINQSESREKKVFARGHKSRKSYRSGENGKQQ
jgi:hypothetical protein